MANDSILAVRSGLLKLMKANAALVALVPKASIFSQWTKAVPAYPFIRCGSPIGIPLRASCLDGAEVTLAVHGFSSGIKDSSASITLPAEDHAGQIGAAIAKALDRQNFAISGGEAKVRWTGSQLMIDPEETEIFHTVQNFRVKCMTA